MSCLPLGARRFNGMSVCENGRKYAGHGAKRESRAVGCVTSVCENAGSDTAAGFPGREEKTPSLYTVSRERTGGSPRHYRAALGGDKEYFTPVVLPDRQ